MSDLPGLDLAALAPWFAQNVPDAAADLRAQLIVGGRSNLTYRIESGPRVWVLRRPPLGHVLSTAHDMGREFRIMSALAPTDVPVPQPIARCDDPAVIGAPFFVMQFVDGTAYRSAAALAALGADRTRAVSERLVDSLAALGRIDPVAVGLADFGHPDGYLGRQVQRWSRQFAASRTRELPAEGALHDALDAAVPAESSTGIVHGDFRLDNVLVDAADRPAAVIDWEMATLGDPLADLALMIVYQRSAAMLGAAVADASLAPGYLTEVETLERYATATGRGIPRFGWYLALASYKLAGIVEGIHARFTEGMTVGAGYERIGELTAPLLDAGLAALREDD